MPKKITSKSKRVQSVPEKNIDNLTIWPASYKLGPTPRNIKDIRKIFLAHKINKAKTRGGKRQKIIKNIEKLREIINKCTTVQEKTRFSILLTKEKNNLNRLRKHKKMNVAQM